MIRPAAPDDATALGALQIRCWREAYGELVPPGTLDSEPAERRARVWRRLLARDMATLVYERDGELTGFACHGPARDEDLSPQVGELYALYVLAVRHGRGDGPALHDRALAELHDAGSATAVVWVIADNARARRFYEKAGWRLDPRVGERPMRWGLAEVRYRRELP